MDEYLTSDVLFPVINFLILKFSTLNDPWSFTGSVGQFVQGMDLQPHDIDIQTTKDGALSINKLLQEFCKKEVFFRESSSIKSYFGAFSYNNIKIEVMGDLQKLVDGEWTKTPDLAEIIKKVTWRELKVPVMDLKYEMKAYEYLGRKERANKIKLFLER